ncbi:MAG: hypothetical protein NC483_05345 [Ruminococcus sp.]|nr:hypothetical protein [Ruminococcus sp.]
MSNKAKNILIGGLIVLLVIAGIIIFVLITNSNSKELNITGEVLISDSNYIILKSGTNDYLINNIKGTYNIGDKIKVSYKEKDLDKKGSPYNLQISDEELVEAAKENNSDDSIDNNTNLNDDNDGLLNNSITNTNNNFNTTNKDNIISNENNSSNKIPTNNFNNNESLNGDTEIINYFNDLDTEFKSGNIKESLKSGFVTVVDFLFYNGTIKGHTFNELSNNAKLKVLSLALYFDSKIDTYFPGYKESISNSVNKVYTNVKEKIVTTYLTITTNICSSNPTLCEEAKNNFASLKTNFGLTWSLIKDIAGDGINNLKNWYEIWASRFI